VKHRAIIEQLSAPVVVEPVSRILVADDSRSHLAMLSAMLRRWGYHVTEATDGLAARALLERERFDIVLSDWSMPGMGGVELCRLLNEMPWADDVHFFLLAAREDKLDAAVGLDAGAADFLSKPVHPAELRARIGASARLIEESRRAALVTRQLEAALSQITRLYDQIDRDLIEARKLQQTLVRERQRDFQGGRATLMLRPAGHVGGDLAGFFDINQRRVVVYSVDVSGHGVASAMMTARLAGLLSSTFADQNIALTTDAYGRRAAWPPELVISRLNRMMIEELQVEQYATVAYAEIDLVTGNVLLTQAGHPHPMVLRQDGRVEKLGRGGLPVGLISDARYDRIETHLAPGDRLFILSDGVTECPSPEGIELGDSGLQSMLIKNRSLGDSAILEALIWDLAAHAGTDEFPDDVSGVLFRYDGRATS
jgi:sigma-B regulation protein RsbU (phosphoserine phosphatase)